MHFFSVLFWTLLVPGMQLDRTFDDTPILSNGLVAKKYLETSFSATDSMKVEYGRGATDHVLIDIVGKFPIVHLGDIEDIKVIKYREDDSGLDIVFASREAYDMGVKSWSHHPSLVLMAGRLSDCDVDDQHEYHLTSDMHWYEDSLVVEVDSQQKELADIACESLENIWSSFHGTDMEPAASVQATFSGVRFHQQDEGNFFSPGTWDTITTSKAGQPLSDPPSVVGMTKQGYFNTNFTYSGQIYTVPGERWPRRLFVDVNITSADGIPQDLNVAKKYNGTVGFQEEYVDSYIFGVPGVIEIQPSLQYSGGVEISAVSPTFVNTTLNISLVDGHIHLDMIHPENAYVTGLWDGNYNAGVAIYPVAEILVSPFISITTVFNVEVPGLNTTFYSGFKSTAKTIYEFLPNATDDFCTTTSYAYSIDAFNLDGFRRTLYSRQDPVPSGCP